MNSSRSKHSHPVRLKAYSTETEAFAHFAYDRCIEWYGEPVDAQWPMYIVLGRISGCLYAYLGKCYLMTIAHSSVVEDEFESIGHEMFHRFTRRTKGLRNIAWIDEILAYLTSQSILREHGLEAYAASIEKRYLDQDGLEVDAFFRFSRRNRLKGLLRGEFYPDGFTATLIKVSTALNFLLDWPHICSLVRCQQWEEWLSSLPLDLRSPACILLNLQEGSTGSLELSSNHQDCEFSANDEIRYRLAVAMSLRGDYDFALRELKQLVIKNPADADMHYSLGVVLGKKGYSSESLEAWQHAVNLSPTNIEYRYLLADALRKAGHLKSAITEYQIVLRQEPQHAKARYYLSIALKETGDSLAASRELKRLLRGEDPAAAEWARQMLDYWQTGDDK